MSANTVRNLIFVPGILTPHWMTRHLSMLLRHHDLKVSVFKYRSRAATPREHAVALAGYIEQFPAERLALLGHSYGGILLMHLFALDEPARDKVQAAVLMASPVAGSNAAKRLSSSRFSWFARALLGVALEEGLSQPAPAWQNKVSLGVMAGVHRAGVTALLTSRREKSADRGSDGVVSVDETIIPGCTAAIQLKTSHAGFLWSSAAAGQVAHFLKHQRFSGE